MSPSSRQAVTNYTVIPPFTVQIFYIPVYIHNCHVDDSSWACVRFDDNDFYSYLIFNAHDSVLYNFKVWVIRLSFCYPNMSRRNELKVVYRSLMKLAMQFDTHPAAKCLIYRISTPSINSKTYCSKLFDLFLGDANFYFERQSGSSLSDMVLLISNLVLVHRVSFTHLFPCITFGLL